MKYIVPLHESWPLRDEATQIVGGKAWSLSELVKGGFKVPRGFVLNVQACEDAMRHAGITHEIETSLAAVRRDNIVSVERAAEFVSSLVRGVQLPKNMIEEIKEALGELGADALCVRSSAIHEDLPGASWAGQYESVVAVPRDNVVGAILQCWSSLYAPRALMYGTDESHRNARMAVVVQEYIPADVSGVAFSSDPVSGNKEMGIIEAVWGMGEAVVSGETTPDTYIVSKKRGIVEKKLHTQRAEVVRGALGTVWRSMTDARSTTQKLPDKKVIALSELVQSIETLMAYDVDVEWVYARGEFYFLQARPITGARVSIAHPIVEYATSREWSLRARHDELLFFYALRSHGMRLFMTERHDMPMIETAFVPRHGAYPLVVVTVASWGELLSRARTTVVKDPSVLHTAVLRDNQIWKELRVISSNITERVSREDLAGAEELVRRGNVLYEEHGGLYYTILALGMQLTQVHGKIAHADEALREHDEWRNSMTFSEEVYINAVSTFFEYSVRTHSVDVSYHDVIKYLTWNECERWFTGKIYDREVQRIIFERSHHGYVYVTLRDFPDAGVIVDRGDARALADHFIRLQIADERHDGKILRGAVAWNGGSPVEGEVVVVLDASELKTKHIDMHNKILVAPQTKPHYIPYVNPPRAYARGVNARGFQTA